jgi:hypothetical protein
MGEMGRLGARLSAAHVLKERKPIPDLDAAVHAMPGLGFSQDAVDLRVLEIAEVPGSVLRGNWAAAALCTSCAAGSNDWCAHCEFSE